MLDFERRHDVVPFDPQHVDQTDRVHAWCLAERRRKVREATFAQASAIALPAPIVDRDVHRVAKRAPEVPQPALHFGVTAIARVPCGVRFAGGGIPHARQIGEPLSLSRRISCQRRRGIATGTDVEQETADCAEIVR